MQTVARPADDTQHEYGCPRCAAPPSEELEPMVFFGVCRSVWNHETGEFFYGSRACSMLEALNDRIEEQRYELETLTAMVAR